MTDIKHSSTSNLEAWSTVRLKRKVEKSIMVLSLVNQLESEEIGLQKFISDVKPFLERYKNKSENRKSHPMGTFSGLALIIDVLATLDFLDIELPEEMVIPIWRLIGTTHNLDTYNEACGDDNGYFPMFSQHPRDSIVYGKPKGRQGNDVGADLKLANAFTGDVLTTALFRIQGSLTAEMGRFSGSVDDWDPWHEIDKESDEGKLIGAYREAVLVAFTSLTLPKTPLWQSPIVSFINDNIKEKAKEKASESKRKLKDNPVDKSEDKSVGQSESKRKPVVKTWASIAVKAEASVKVEAPAKAKASVKAEAKSDVDGEASLRKLFTELKIPNMDAVIKSLLSDDVTVDVLPFLSVEDLVRLVPKFGSRLLIHKWIEKQTASVSAVPISGSPKTDADG